MEQKDLELLRDINMLLNEGKKKKKKEDEELDEAKKRKAKKYEEELDEAKKKKSKKDDEDLQESGGPSSSPLEDVVHMLARASETGNAALMKQAKSNMSKLPSDVKKSLNVLIKNMK